MALVTIRRSSSVQAPKKTDGPEKANDSIENDIGSQVSKSLNECYFANKGAALVLGTSERGWAERRGRARGRSPPRVSQHPQPDIQHHLQAMFNLLRPEETLKMAVKLESAHAGRTRFLVVVCRGDEAALLGIDCNELTTIGLVLRVLADTSIKLDGDGGFSVCVCNQQHIFKPVSVQAMWSALQTLHRAGSRARALNQFAGAGGGGASHAWCAHYEARVRSDRSCLNEWHAMDSIESRRPPSPDSLRLKPRERDETERVIRCTLKEIMMSVDLDEVTSKAIRGRLEDELDMDLAEYKPFIDHEMITILGQMDAPTEIFDHVYLGSEWNASNLEELQRNGVRHILNVTREIDNFFPGMFDYLNIRVYDDDKTDLLKHWDNTFKYINKVRNEGSKVLVHCKMGISRSASVVIAYAMKAYNWNFDKALKHVKTKRNCIKPNTNFLNQLVTYQGILDAMKNKEKLQRSKSETNLKSPKSVSKSENKVIEPTPLVLALTGSYSGRPRSWSPDTKLASELLPPTSVSLENLAMETRHMLMPCAYGSYSVSPNQIIRLKEEGVISVKHIVNEIENASCDRRELTRKYQKLNFGSQCDTMSSRSSDASVLSVQTIDAPSKPLQVSPLRTLSHKHPPFHTEADRIHTWDPGEAPCRSEEKQSCSDIDNIVKSDSGIMDVKTKTNLDILSSSIDRNLDYEDKKTEEEAPPPSRQSSWSSFDSAVVPDLSRHSSWGSYDTRLGRPPVLVQEDKNTKEGLEERSLKRDDERGDKNIEIACTGPRQMDLGIINEHTEPRRGRRLAPGAISDNERKFNETCAILRELEVERAERGRVGGAMTWGGRGGEGFGRGVALRRRRATCASQPDLRAPGPHPRVAPPAHPAHGLVRNLKKEFEARLDLEPPRRPDSRSRARDSKERMPPSPPTPPTPPGEDLSVKVLVDMYDRPCRSRHDSGCESKKTKSAHESSSKKSKPSEKESRTAARNSFCGAVRGGGAGGGSAGAERPPPAPTVLSLAPLNFHNGLVSTVMSKAQSKKQLQHGKTHPLTRLNRSTTRCSNPVYNTM